MNKCKIQFTYYGTPYVAIIQFVIEDERLQVIVLSCQKNTQLIKENAEVLLLALSENLVIGRN